MVDASAERDLTGKVALVCAASQGLGKAAAHALAARGARVAICSRRHDAIERAAADIGRATGADVAALVADLSRPADPARVVAQTVERCGGLDILITNTGGPRSAPFESLTDDDWSGAVDSMLMSVVRLCRAALPAMRARGGGRIVLITSVSVRQPVEGLMLSNAIRAAVTGFAKTLAGEVARDNILVNCVAPGFTRTERVSEITAATASREHVSADEVEGRIVRQIPMGRLGEPNELAALIAFLASPASGYVTGTALQVDGGYVKSVL
jgi:3-oxoacyl-[acyl-carrier protein] reductase